MNVAVARQQPVLTDVPDRWGKARTRELFAEYQKTRAMWIRNEIVAMHLNLVKFVVVRFSDRGEPLEDLYQVGCLGLVKAIERFDVGIGTQFTTYAIPTIIGEIKRYFRDKAWSLRVPRRLQDLKQAVSRITETLTSHLGRCPNVSEIAHALKISEEEVLEAQELGQVYSMLSLDSEIETEQNKEPASLMTFLGEHDAQLANIENQVTVEQALTQLTNRERLVIHLRFYQNYSQRETAEVLGISQMHVSRLQNRAINNLKGLLSRIRHE